MANCYGQSVALFCLALHATSSERGALLSETGEIGGGRGGGGDGGGEEGSNGNEK